MIQPGFGSRSLQLQVYSIKSPHWPSSERMTGLLRWNCGKKTCRCPRIRTSLVCEFQNSFRANESARETFRDHPLGLGPGKGRQGREWRLVGPEPENSAQAKGASTRLKWGLEAKSRSLISPFQGPPSETWKTRTRMTITVIIAGDVAVEVVGAGTYIALTMCQALLFHNACSSPPRKNGADYRSMTGASTVWR